MARARQFGALLAVSLVLSCGVPKAPSAAGEVVWRYEVRVNANLDLDVEATLSGLARATPLRVEDSAMPFLDVRARGATVRYRVRAMEAARALRDVDVAYPAPDAVFAPPSTWLLRPRDVPAHGRFRFHVTTAPGVTFATAIHRAAAVDTWEADIGSLEDASYAAFGALDVEPVPGAEVRIASARSLQFSSDATRSWLIAETRALTALFGRSPRATVFVTPGDSEVMRGKTLGEGGAGVMLRVPATATDQSLRTDWVAAHELVHVCFPALAPDFAWFSEGLATYVEPIARARAGLITPEQVWFDFVDGLPRGLPKPEDGGLDGTHDIDRVYWGGALYFLLADVALRERSGGRQSLDTVLRAIAASGANVEQRWELARVLDDGDRATGLPVLRELYARFGGNAASVDLDALWARLGIRRDGATVRFDETAPLAAVRRAITSGDLR